MILRSLHAKFLGGTLLVLALVMAAVLVVVEQRQRAAIVGELQRRGEVLARNLAAMSYGPLLLYNFTALEQNVARVGAEADVVYAIVLDADGKIAAHSRRPERVGEALGERRQPSVSEFAVPVMVDGRPWGGVRVGLSRGRMDAEILRTRLELGALTLVILLLGGVAAAVMARRIAGPVRALAEGAAAISRGELAQRIEPATADEIGRLAAAFNHMAVQLFQQRTALEEAHAELTRQFEELADLKTYADSILASMPNGIVTVDLDGRVVTLNPAAELLTGYFRGEVAGRYCTEVFAHTPELSDVLMDTLASRAPIANLTLTLRRRNGSTVPIEFSTTPLKGGESKDLGVIGVFRDLTLVRRLESDLRRSDQLAALGTLAAGLAHEIKNPLTSLLTFSRHLDRRFDDPGFRQKFQSVVPRELERINVIVERLLELARPTRLAFGLVRLPELLERALELYTHQLDAKAIEVRRQYARDVPPIQADAEGLYRVFVNLVANALEATGPRGRLTLRAGWADAADAPLAARRRGGDRGVKVEIEDTGCGIAASDRDRVFHPFYTTREGGTGLGLALAHKIVEDHGGSIGFRSAEGRGTTFTIVLPLVAEPPAGADRREEPRR
ncbi:MAG: PAS domain-containing protein [Candidatus Rokubacteria bacterium]|nr:PAS domain-containing protein [Candidatus Rokubacteria bacterium]